MAIALSNNTSHERVAKASFKPNQLRNSARLAANLLRLVWWGASTLQTVAASTGCEEYGVLVADAYS